MTATNSITSLDKSKSLAKNLSLKFKPSKFGQSPDYLSTIDSSNSKNLRTIELGTIAPLH